MHGHEQPSGQVRLPPSSLGFVVGFAIGFPGNFAQATWSPIPPVFPLGWMLEMWIGAILATLVAGFLYKERRATRRAASLPSSSIALALRPRPCRRPAPR